MLESIWLLDYLVILVSSSSHLSIRKTFFYDQLVNRIGIGTCVVVQIMITMSNTIFLKSVPFGLCSHSIYRVIWR